MKFIVFALLGLCAFAAAEEIILSDEQSLEFDTLARGKILETLREKVQEIIKKAQHEFDVISLKVKEVVLKVHEHILAIASEAKEKLDGMREEVREKLEELKQKGEHFRQCAEELEPEYKQVEKGAIAEVKECTAQVVEAYEIYRKDIEKDVTEIKEDVDEFGALISECFDVNPVTTVKCVYGKMAEFKNLIDGVVKASKNALSIARDRAVEVISDVRSCNKAAFEKVYSRVALLNSELDKCYKEH